MHSRLIPRTDLPIDPRDIPVRDLIGPRRECGFFFCPWGCDWHIRHGKPCRHRNEAYCAYDRKEEDI